MGEEIVYKDDQLAKITEVFRLLLVQYVDPTSILVHLRLNLVQHYRSIQDASDKERTAGMDLLLTTLEQMSDQRGLYRAFMSALRTSGNKFLHDVIEGKTRLSENWEIYKTLLQVFFPKLINISPTELMTHLTCLNESDREAVRVKTTNQGNTRGACELFLRLEAKPDTTMTEILKGLREINYPVLANELEEAASSSLKQDHKLNISEVVDGGDSNKEIRREVNNDSPNGASDSDMNQRSTDVAHSVFPANMSDHKLNISEVVDGGDSNKEIRPEVNNDSPNGASDSDMNQISTDVAHSVFPANMSAVSNTQRQVGYGNDNEQNEFEEVKELEELNLRDYQQELAVPALEGKNTIIVAPTGSGKTHVAVSVAKHVLQSGCGASSRPPKVIFVVNKVPLVEQQRKVFQTYIKDVVGISGDMSAQVPLVEHLGQADVIVLTAQILVNAIEGQGDAMSLSQISLLILDECHNTQKGNPYNVIMANYRDMKRMKPDEPRPQIVGLTASLGVGKAKRQYDAEGHILKLCANLDADEISTVKQHKDSLDNRCNKPHEETIGMKGRGNADPYKRVIEGIMEKVEQKIFSVPDGQQILTRNRELKEMSSHRGTQQYEGEVTRLKEFISLSIENPELTRQFLDCANFLEVYNQSLYISRDARTIDAFKFVKSYIDDMKDKQQDAEETTKQLIALFEEQEEDLRQIYNGPSNENPVLKRLGKILLKEYTESPETLGILFTNTRNSTQVLKAWIEESDQLRDINPGTLIGTGNSGMTQSQQVKLLAMFKEKKHRLVISTSVAEEGLDIQMCNLVVRYNYVRDDIGRVQARGRSRAKDGKFFLIFNDNLPNLADRERINKIREHMMVKATETVYKMIRTEKEQFQQVVQKKQEDDYHERKLKQSGVVATKKRSLAQKTTNDFTLLCKHCRHKACFSDDIRCINNQHHVVQCDEFTEQRSVLAYEESRVIYEDVEITQKIFCGNCKKEWGFTIIYKGHELPMVSIKSFVIESSKGRKFHAKKWKDVPFKVKDMYIEDLAERLNVVDEEKDDEKNTELS